MKFTGLVFACALGAWAAPVGSTFTGTSGSFSGTNAASGTCIAENGGYCANGDGFTQTLAVTTLTATAWNSISPGANFTTAELFKSGSAPTYVGLGVCNSAEGIPPRDSRTAPTRKVTSIIPDRSI